MKNLKIIISVGFAAALVLAVITGARMAGPQTVAQPDSLTARALAARTSLPSSGGASLPAPASERSTFTGLPEESIPNQILIEAAQELGRVNGKIIQLKDLVPLQPGESGTTMTAVQYQSRFERAIEAELMFQEAKRQGVALTPQQQERLDKIADEHVAGMQELQKQGITWSSAGAVEFEHEKRLLAAQMLQQNLVAKKAAVSPSTDPQIQALFEAARRELLDQLHASAQITRAELSL